MKRFLQKTGCYYENEQKLLTGGYFFVKLEKLTKES